MAQYFINFSLPLQLFIIYIIVINIVTFFAFGIDKMKSRKQSARRYSEKSLWILSLIGGTPGGFLGMTYFRHKTKKISFQAGMAIVLAIQIVLLYFIYS